MQKVKVFVDRNVLNIEKEINQYLMENSGERIVNITSMETLVDNELWATVFLVLKT